MNFDGTLCHAMDKLIQQIKKIRNKLKSINPFAPEFSSFT